MLRLLQWLLFGHTHKWKTVDQARCETDYGGIYTRYYLQCETCGNMKPQTTPPFGRPFWVWVLLFSYFGLTYLQTGYLYSAAGVGLFILIILWSEGELKWKN